MNVARRRFPGLKIVAHPECAPDVAAASDFVGSTGAMMSYVRGTRAPYFLMLTECGLVDRLQIEAPEKTFVGGCRLCPYMKLNSLESILRALKSPTSGQVIVLDEVVRAKAARCIELMFELAPKD
jgi:quinolinate synthase